MITTIRTYGSNVIISFDGRLNTATSAEANDKINRELNNIDTIESVTCDASRLEYISSSGLRILLSLARRYTNFSVTGVLPQVYEVLETTGFTKIMTVERALRRMVIECLHIINRLCFFIRSRVFGS